MSHSSHLPPYVDEAVRTFIRRHKHTIRKGCLLAGLNALEASGKARPIPLLSTHPAPQERMDRLNQKMALLNSGTFRSFDREFLDLQAALGIAPARP